MNTENNTNTAKDGLPVKTIKVRNLAKHNGESIDPAYIKEALMKALDAFNIQRFCIPSMETIEIGNYKDQDGYDNLILVNKKYIESEGEESRFYQHLYTFYNNTYSTGTECLDKSRLLSKVMKKISPDVEISSTTLFSFILVMNPFSSNEASVMSTFWYNVMKISNPEMFSK